MGFHSPMMYFYCIYLQKFSQYPGWNHSTWKLNSRSVLLLFLVTLILDHPFSWGGVVNLDLDGPPGLFACKQSLSGKGSNLTWWKLRGSCFGLFCARTDTIYVSIYLPIYLTIYPSSYLILSYLILSYLIWKLRMPWRICFLGLK